MTHGPSFMPVVIYTIPSRIARKNSIRNSFHIFYLVIKCCARVVITILDDSFFASSLVLASILAFPFQSRWSSPLSDKAPLL